MKYFGNPTRRIARRILRTSPAMVAGFAVFAVFGLAAERSARATNHEIGMTEIAAGVNNDPNAQFVEIRMLANGQNLWGPQPGETKSRAVLTFFDGAGNQTGIFEFTANAPDTANRFVLIGTQAFKNLPNQPDPDIIMPPLMKPGSGRVCFRTNKDNLAFIIAECVAYGSFPAAKNSEMVGDPPDTTTFTFGNPVPSQLPITGFSSIRRNEVGDPIFGFGFSDTDDNATDFFLSTSPTPTASGGTLPDLPPAEVAAGRQLFEEETFGGNGRTCATCHVLTLNGALPPANIKARFQNLATTFDPLFIAEKNMNLNTLTLSTATAFADGAILQGTAGGAPTTVKVRAKLSSTSYLIHGGIAPALTPGTTITDGTNTGSVFAISKGDLNGLENPTRMHGPSVSPSFPDGRGLILENIDGFANAPVFRKSPHMQNLKFSGPFGFNNDVLTLEEFVVGAVKQHFPRTLQRRPGIDFRLPTPEEARLMKVFMLSLDSIPGGNIDKHNLGHFARTASQRRGRQLFEGQGCNACHSSSVLSGDVFATGVNAQAIDGPPPGGDNLPMDAPNQSDTTNRPIGAPGLFNVKNNGPFFHEASRLGLEEAVRFYITDFRNSPEGQNFTFNLSDADVTDVARFLAGLVARDYVVLDGGGADVTRNGTSVDFGQRLVSDPVATKTLTVKNISTNVVQFAPTACQITAFDLDTPADFPAPDCSQINGILLQPGQSKTITVRFDPLTAGTKSAILELNSGDPTGVDLTGLATTAEVEELFDRDNFSGPPRFVNQRSDGFFFVTGGQLQLSGCFTCPAPNGNVLTHQFDLPPSFTLSVDGIATDTTSSVNDFSVIFNFRDINNYYYASFNEKDTLSGGADDPNTNGIFKVVNGTRTQIRDFSTTTTAGNDTAPLHAVRIEKIRSTIRVFRDNALMGVVTDSTFTGGKAGVGSFNDSGRFDNFTIRAHVLGEDFTTSGNPFTTMLGGSFGVTGGKLQLTNPATSITIPNANIAVHPTLLPAGDFEVFVDGNATASSSSNDDFTVVFNFQNVTNYMFVNFGESNDSTTNGIFRVVNSVRTQIVGFGTTFTAPGTPRRIRVQKTANTIRVLRDGTQIGTSVTDATFSGGQMGVGSRNNAATFDNVFVEKH